MSEQITEAGVEQKEKGTEAGVEQTEKSGVENP